MLTVGFLHGELTSLLWGGAFGFLWTYVFVARTIVGWSRRFVPQGSLEGIPGPGLVFRTHHRPAAPAFFGWWLGVEGVHSATRRFGLRVALTTETTEIPLTLPRGRYEVKARWELRDAFGFTRTIPAARWETVVTVEPRGRPFAPPPPPPTRPGPWRPRKTGRRSGDPFDVRPYTAGDDLRRFHWPLYAHSGNPFVRTAEPSPPPLGHQWILLDTDAPTEEALDSRLESLVTWLAALDAQQTGWTVVVPAANLTLGSGQSVSSALAPLTPRPFPDRPADLSWPGEVTLLTGPESPSAPRLANRLAATRRRLHPVFVAPSLARALKPRPWWKR